MPLPLIPFVVGAAAGAAVTYLLTNKSQDRDPEPFRVIHEDTNTDVEEPLTTDEKPDSSKPSKSG